MAQTKRKRRRKHRGTPAGTIDRPGRTGQPRTRQEAKDIARQRRQDRLDRPPTLKGAATRAAIAAAVLAVVIVAAFGKPVEAAIPMAAFAFLIYIPLGYLTDNAIYRFRQRRKAARTG